MIDKVYNYAGRDDVKDNWKLRLGSDYEKSYHGSVETGSEPAMNMPELLGMAVNSKSSLAIAKGEVDEETGVRIKDLKSRLGHWETVLKEPES